MEQIEKTQFYIGGAVGRVLPRSSDKCLGNVIRIDNFALKRASVLVRCWYRFRMWILYLHKIADTEIYAQDHIAFSQALICGGKYTLLEDGPGFYRNCKNNKLIHPFKNSFFRRIAVWFTWGRIQGNIFGLNKQCINRIVTTHKDLQSEVLKGRNVRYCNLRGLWQNSTDEKRKFVLNVFNFTDTLRLECQKAETIILTQPFCVDTDMTSDELANIYRPYVEKYKKEGVIIKSHPRDRTDYKKYFPYAICISVPVPMQLLVFVGVNFKRAVTVFSTAVSEFGKETELIILGTDVNEKLLATYGHIEAKTYCP
ncbi:MAG: hypothetical protein IKF72_14255 [Kiritimatiellae bacterium]|nr:hypothetical protein [Kiritimatiellia bacterium]